MLGAAGVCAVLAGLAAHYVPFDASRLPFVHYRLPGVRAARDLYLIAACVWFAGFAAVVATLVHARVPRSRRAIGIVLAAQAAIGLAFAVLPMAIDSDQYAYIGYGYAAAHEDPYLTTHLPAGAPPPVVRAFEHWGNPLPPDAYGAAWTAGNEALLRLVGRDPVRVQTIVLRLTALAAACATTVLLSMLPGVPLPALALFALDPLVVLETGNGAHNDIYLVACGIGALVLLLRGRSAFAGMALGLAAAIKFAYAPFVLPLAVAAWSLERRASGWLLAAGGFLGVILAASGPYGFTAAAIEAPLRDLGREGGVLGMIDRVAAHVPILRAHAAIASSALVALALVVTVLLLAIDARARRVVPPVAVLAAVLLVIAAGKIEPWYVLMAAPLVAVPSHLARIAFASLSAGGLWLSQVSFTGTFPIASACAIALFCAVVFAALLPVRLPFAFVGSARRRG